MGRKIKFHFSTKTDPKNITYIDEGQFVNDHINGTFGRRIYWKNKYYPNRIGWLNDNGDRKWYSDNLKLHGYGMKYELGEGLFEQDGLVKSKNDIEVDFNNKDIRTQKIMLDLYLVNEL